MSKFIGKKVIVRADRAGVFFGTLVGVENRDVTMQNVRKLWSWEGACAVEELAVNGVAKPEECKFTVVVEEMEISDSVQILPCTDKAIASIEGVREWMF